MDIKVRVKNVYGNDLIYPITHQTELATLTGKKTLDQRDIQALQALGITVTNSNLTLEEIIS